jgi:hypothetical protein
MVLAINQRYLGIDVSKAANNSQSTKAGADDDNAGFLCGRRGVLRLIISID